MGAGEGTLALSALTPVTYLNRKSEEEGLVSIYRIYLPLVLKSAG